MPRETLGLFLGFLGVVIFGGSLPGTRLAVADLAPWFVTFGRAAIAGVMALAVLLLLRKPFPKRDMWLAMVISSLCLVIGFPGLTGLAMQTVPSSHGGVVLGLLPLATAICGTILTGERPSPAFWACGVLGAALVVIFAVRDSDMTLSLGDIYLFMAVGICALGYAYSARLSKHMPGWEVISWLCVIALPFTAPAAIYLIPPDPSAVRTSAWAGFAYVAVMSQYIGFFAWNAGLALGGVARVSQVQLLQTFVTLAIAALVLGEKVDLTTVVFAVAVVGVVLLGRRTTIKAPGA
jgi:drug/metabolite transporter (DMT)-like permease